MRKEDVHFFAALCYLLWPVPAVLLVLDKREVRYHAINGLGFAGGVLVLWLLLLLLVWIPVLGWIVQLLFWIVIILLAVRYAIDAYNGKRPEIPVVTNFLKRNVKGF